MKQIYKFGILGIVLVLFSVASLMNTEAKIGGTNILATSDNIGFYGNVKVMVIADQTTYSRTDQIHNITLLYKVTYTPMNFNQVIYRNPYISYLWVDFNTSESVQRLKAISMSYLNAQARDYNVTIKYVCAPVGLEIQCQKIN